MWNFDQLGLVTLKAGSMKKSEKYGHSDEFVPSDPEEVTLALMEVRGSRILIIITMMRKMLNI